MPQRRRRQPARRPVRREPSREPRASILIVCEGEKTEPSYFRSLCGSLELSNTEVEIVKSGSASAPISVVSRAVELRDARRRDSSRVDYDEIWCVMDVEVPEAESLRRALNKARGQNLDVALSNPCFEFWILLHFEYCGTLFHGCKAVVKRLKKHIPKYKKGQDIFSRLEPNTNQAIQRAESLCGQVNGQESAILANVILAPKSTDSSNGSKTLPRMARLADRISH